MKPFELKMLSKHEKTFEFKDWFLSRVNGRVRGKHSVGWLLTTAPAL